MVSVFDVASAAAAAKVATIGGQIAQYTRRIGQASALPGPVAGIITGGQIGSGYFAGGTTFQGTAIPDSQPTAPPVTRASIDTFQSMRRGAGPNGLPESAFMGGYTPQEARQLLGMARQNRPAMKSLFMIDIAGPANALSPAEMGLTSDPSVNGLAVEDAFSFFATECSYNLITIEGEKRKIGSAQADTVDSGSPTDFTITAMDDERGTLKRWFRALAARAAASDGTVGVPADYAITIEITHAIASQSAVGFALSYFDAILVRPKSVEYELSRSARTEVQTFQMGFTQLDTFVRTQPVNSR